MSDELIEVEINALKSDATAWDCVGESQRSLSRALDDLGISASDLNPRADSLRAAHASYSAFVGTVQRVLAEASTASIGAAQALREVAADYAIAEGEADRTALGLLARTDVDRPGPR